jgi:hypothetical protein
MQTLLDFIANQTRNKLGTAVIVSVRPVCPATVGTVAAIIITIERLAVEAAKFAETLLVIAQRTRAIAVTVEVVALLAAERTVALPVTAPKTRTTAVTVEVVALLAAERTVARLVTAPKADFQCCRRERHCEHQSRDYKHRN